MAHSLPAWITSTLSERLEGVSRADLSKRALSISETYRSGGNSSRIDQPLDAVAYAASRMPATYAAVKSVMSGVVDMAPDYAPTSMLDIGAGPGTATWACLQTFPSIERAGLLDRNPALLGLAEAFAGAAPTDDTTFEFSLASFAGTLAGQPKRDLVIASYALTELSLAAAIASVIELWNVTRDMLVIIEPGTTDGAKRIRAYRDALIKAGGEIVAPCTHKLACPLAETERWCHFSQRLARSREHMALKKGTVPYEDEKFSYLAVSRAKLTENKSRRILASPKITKGQACLTLCAPHAVEEMQIPRKSADLYRAAKRSDWGDIIDI